MESTKLSKYTIHYPNSNEYHTLKREIWGQDCYYFHTEKDNPYIIDVGAHIGLSVLYFKDLYPKSELIAFEPQKESFEILQQNIDENELSNVTLLNKAIWKESGIKPFYIDNTENNWYSNGSMLKGSWNGKESTKEIQVEVTTLKEYLSKEVDCLKIDTEGSELTILKSIKGDINKIKNIFIEYHPTKGSNINEILSILKSNFQIEILSEGKILKKIPQNHLAMIKGTHL